METKISEQLLKDTGFERHLIPIEESGDDKDFHYYTLDIGDICLMSNDNWKAQEEGWKIEIFDFPSMSIDCIEDLLALINILDKNTNK